MSPSFTRTGGVVRRMATSQQQNVSMRECADDCNRCRSVCEQTLAHCISKGGKHVEEKHLKLLLDCIDTCTACGAMCDRDSQHCDTMCRTCAEVCRACADSCDRFDDPQMKACAEECRRCAESCQAMAA